MHAAPRIAQERDRVPGRTIAVAAIVAIAISAALAGLAWALAGPDRGAAADSERERVIADEVNEIELTLFPWAPGLDKQARQQRHLRRYGWIDRERGVLHIPIERAIELYISQEENR